MKKSCEIILTRWKLKISGVKFERIPELNFKKTSSELLKTAEVKIWIDPEQKLENLKWVLRSSGKNFDRISGVKFEKPSESRIWYLSGFES